MKDNPFYQMYLTEKTEYIFGHHFGNGEEICVECVDVSLAYDMGLEAAYDDEFQESDYFDPSEHRLSPMNLSNYYQWLGDRDSAWPVTQYSGHDEENVCDICGRTFWDPAWTKEKDDE